MKTAYGHITSKKLVRNVPGNTEVAQLRIISFRIACAPSENQTAYISGTQVRFVSVEQIFSV
jgi:hypothetical protein